MKKYLVIGNPIDHSLSPKLHNKWFKENNINATYEKKKLEEKDLPEIINEVKKGKIDGINVIGVINMTKLNIRVKTLSDFEIFFTNKPAIA